MALIPKDRQYLKAQAHKLKPIVFIGRHGLSANVNMEIDRGLTDHELIKVRIQTQDRELRRSMYEEICKTHRAEPVQLVGNIATLYRENED